MQAKSERESAAWVPGDAVGVQGLGSLAGRPDWGGWCFTHMGSGVGAGGQAPRSKSHPSHFSSPCLSFLFYKMGINLSAASSVAGE